jgi:putative transposase
MPRQARLDIPGALHHIMVRGINRSKIFEDSRDKILFLERLGKNVLEGQCSIYAWVLMDNHVHILLKSGRHGISTLMLKQLTWYAQYYNHRHNRTGNLFENRYKSILYQEDKLLALIRYIHLNPGRARIVKTISELDRYPWSGHWTVMGNADHEWMDTEYVLKQFGSRVKAARKAYHGFVAEGMTLGKVRELTGGSLIRSKGGWAKVPRI